MAEEDDGLLVLQTTSVEIPFGGGSPVARARRAGRAPAWPLAWKHFVDRAVAACILLAAAPLLLAIAVGVRIALGPTVLFRQRRIGRAGVPFTMLKFRSLRATDEAEGGAVELLPFDTAPGGAVDEGLAGFGSFLRRTSLDELPQLLNVLGGSMSLVGPRPERPVYVDRFSQTLATYEDRHRIKPGITGLAQIRGLRGRTSLSERVASDNTYIDTWSSWLDLKILLLTVVAVWRYSENAPGREHAVVHGRGLHDHPLNGEPLGVPQA